LPITSELEKSRQVLLELRRNNPIATGLALFIACIGLFSLVSHHVLQRTKEIGIRKVLGASTENIVALVSKEFLKLV